MPKIKEPVVNIHYEGVGFNRSYLRRYKTAEEFVEAADAHLYAGESNRKELLKEAWALGQETPKALEKLQSQAEGGDLGPVVRDQKEAAKAGVKK